MVLLVRRAEPGDQRSLTSLVSKAGGPTKVIDVFPNVFGDIQGCPGTCGAGIVHCSGSRTRYAIYSITRMVLQRVTTDLCPQKHSYSVAAIVATHHRCYRRVSSTTPARNSTV